MVLYKLMWYPNSRGELFLLLTDKSLTCRRQKNMLREKLIKWKWHYVVGGWGAVAPDPQPYECNYTNFPKEGLPKDEAIHALLQCVFYRRYCPVKTHFAAYYKLPGIDYIFQPGSDYMPQDLWRVPDQDPNDLMLPSTYGHTSYRTIHQTFDMFHKEYDRVFEILHKIIPKHIYEVYEMKDSKGRRVDTTGVNIEKQHIVYIAYKNTKILHAMVRDFAQGICYDIHKYFRAEFDRSEKADWFYLNKERHRQKFDDRYIKMAFLETPFNAPTEEEEEKMNEPWVDDAIRAFRSSLMRNKHRHKEKGYKRIIKDVIELCM